jgi:cell division transport system permease protein
MKSMVGAGRSGGASESRAGWRSHFAAWVRHHRLSAADSLYRVLQNPVSSLLTWLAIGVALALPIGLGILLESAAELGSDLDSSAQISVFLHDEVPTAAADELALAWRELDNVASTRFMSREEALEEFRTLSGFADVLDSLDGNPLPALILVQPAAGLDDNGAQQLLQRLRDDPSTAEVVMDRQWLQRLNRLMDLGRRLVMTVGLLLIFGVVLILGNTIRLAIEGRREEIVIVKLVGGSDSFVRRPFLYTGLWYGVGGGVCAALLVTCCLWFLQQPVQELANLYGSGFSLRMPGLMGALNVILSGGLLGLAGAWLAVTRHLARIQPH